MKKDRTLIDINGVKKFNKFEDIQELLYEAFEFGYKSGYNAHIEEDRLINDMESAYELGYYDGDRTNELSDCSENKEDVVDKAYSIGYEEGYDEGYAQGHKKGYLSRLEDEDEESCEEDWCDCRALGYSQGLDKGYIDGYRDCLMGKPCFMENEEIKLLEKLKKI